MAKQFAVIGLGNFGAQLAVELCQRGAEVLAIDEKIDAVDGVKDHVTHAVRLDATEEEALAGQKLDRFDAVIAGFGADFETLLLTAMILKQLGVKRIVARASTTRHQKILNRLGIDEVVLPVTEAVQRLATSLTAGDLVEALPLASDHAIAEAPAPEEVLGRTVGEVDFPGTYGVQVVSIQRTRELAGFLGFHRSVKRTLLGIIRPDTVIERGDLLVLFGPRKSLEVFARL